MTIEATQREGRARVPRWLSITVTAVVLACVGAAGWWGLSTRQELAGLATIGEAVEVPGGLMRVDGVRPEVMVHQMTGGMPMSMMPDPVPDGFARFSVDVTLIATEPGGVEFEPDRFRVGGEGVPATPPHRPPVAAATVPEHEMMSVSLLFQAPVGADDLWLSYRGAPRSVLLEGDLGHGDHGEHDHGDHDHGDAHDHEQPDVTVRIEDFGFDIADIEVRAGSRIEWVNEDEGIPHTVTFRADGPDSGVMQPGGSFVLTLDEPAVYTYLCTIHPRMTGTVRVVPG